MTAKDFKRIALTMEGAEEGAHMGAVDFRVGGRIFATLASVKKGYGNLMLTPEIQAEFLAERPDLFLPVHGGWGRGGATHIRLAEADEESMRGALQTAWRLRVGRTASRRIGKSAAQRRSGKRRTVRSQVRKSGPGAPQMSSTLIPVLSFTAV
jgi:hypothetical protein